MTDFVNWAAWALLSCAQWSARALSVTFVLEMLESTPRECRSASRWR